MSAYIRIKMHFWHTQPVFHIYNLSYWLNPPGLINTTPPAINKFVNMNTNTLIEIPSLDISGSSVSISVICKFIRDYYIIHESASYKPTEQDIMAYLQCTNQPAFFNIARETSYAFSPTERELTGVISARVLNVTLRPHQKKPSKSFPVYYIDNLCVNPGYRKKGIAPELIQTFYYTISRANPKVNTYLFKREGQLNAIVPLVCYNTCAFDLSQFFADTQIVAPAMVRELGIPHLNLFIGFIKEQIRNFECVILPDISSIINLIKLGKIKIYGLFLSEAIMAIYIFRVLELYYENKKAVECITILSNDIAPAILNAGFALSWLKLNADIRCEIALIEETAHSKTVIHALELNPTVRLKFKSPTAFFLYNYATYSVSSSKALLFY